jgi:hypothetical protein
MVDGIAQASATLILRCPQEKIAAEEKRRTTRTPQ